MYYSYMPRYDEIDYLSKKYLLNDDRSRLNIFFDLKNGLGGDTQRIDGVQRCSLTQENKGEHLVELISSSINVMAFIQNRLSEVIKYKDRVRFFFFCETGKSSYHKGIDMGYKKSRGLNDFLSRDDSNNLHSEIVFNAIYMLKDIVNMIPNAYFFLGEYSEYDYIPYVVYKEIFDEHDTGVVFSSDRDMYQLQVYTDCFEQLEKIPFTGGTNSWHPGRIFVNNSNYLDRLFYKLLIQGYELSDDVRKFISQHLSLVRAIIGDTGDGVKGILGFQDKTLLKHIKEIMHVTLPRDAYNKTLQHMDFDRFDYMHDNTVFDLELVKKVLNPEPVLNEATGRKNKAKQPPKALSLLLSTNGIIRVCRNIALMDYAVMYTRRKDLENIREVLDNKYKFKTAFEAQKFLDATGLWKLYPGIQVSINIE